MLKTIIAIEQDGLDVRVLALNVEMPSKDFDIKAAVKAACTEYCQTEEGRKTYEYNCHSFNWADFAMSVPEEICKKHGFKVIRTDTSDEIVNWDEELVDMDDICDDDDEDCEGCSGCDGTQCANFGCDCMGCTGNCSDTE